MSQELIKLANKIDTSVQLDYGKLGKVEDKSDKTWNDLIKGGLAAVEKKPKDMKLEEAIIKYVQENFIKGDLPKKIQVKRVVRKRLPVNIGSV